MKIALGYALSFMLSRSKTLNKVQRSELKETSDKVRNIFTASRQTSLPIMIQLLHAFEDESTERSHLRKLTAQLVEAQHEAFTAAAELVVVDLHAILTLSQRTELVASLRRRFMLNFKSLSGPR